MTNNGIRISGTPTGQTWTGALTKVAYDDAGIKANLLNLEQTCLVVTDGTQVGVVNGGQIHAAPVAGGLQVLAAIPPINPSQLGDPTFREAHGVKYNYTTGAMANSIASEDLVIAMGKANMLASYGAAGNVPNRLNAAVEKIQSALPNGPYTVNLIHSPSEEKMERDAVDTFLKYGVKTVEASAFLELTPNVVRYRAAGLSRNANGSVNIGNRIIAKISRREVATHFMNPAPDRLLTPLVQQGLITAEQAELAKTVPVADDITCEADSGGHTDNRPLVALLPSILALRDEIQAEHNYAIPVRVGAAGGIGTPSAALASFMMGAAYIVTGSINQSAMEAGSSLHTKKALSQADMADVMMAPAADMFEMGVHVQVLKRGTMFPMRAQKLYEYYTEYDSIEAIPTAERDRLEKSVFRQPLEDIWAGTVEFFEERDPDQIARAKDNPKRKMALIFRWYLGLSSRWSNVGEKGREMDYQIWCGPAMGAFNAWVKGTYMENYENRHVADIAEHMMRGAAFLYRMQMLKMQGADFAPNYTQYVPQAPLVK